MPGHAGPHREAPVLVRRQKEKAWVTTFILVFMGRNEKGMLSS